MTGMLDINKLPEHRKRVNEMEKIKEILRDYEWSEKEWHISIRLQGLSNSEKKYLKR